MSSLVFLPKITLTGTTSTGTAGSPEPAAGTAPVIALSNRINKTAEEAKKSIKSDFDILDRAFNEVAKRLNEVETTLRTEGGGAD